MTGSKPARATSVMPDGFGEVVLAWLNRHTKVAVRVTSVEGCGSDWEGDTLSGFHEDFFVRISYVNAVGARARMDVRGQDLASLWKVVVGSAFPVSE